MPRPLFGLVLAFLLATAVSGLVAPRSAGAMLIVDVVVTPGVGTFDYDITVTNGLADDVILISIPDAPLADALITASITGPAGYAVNYDPGLGIVDLIEDALLFGAGDTVGGFLFTSASGPGPGVFESFEAFTAGLDQVNGMLQVTIVPEPGTAALLGLGLAGVAFARRRATRGVDRA